MLVAKKSNIVNRKVVGQGRDGVQGRAALVILVADGQWCNDCHHLAAESHIQSMAAQWAEG